MKIAFIGQKGIPAVGGGVERYVEDVATRIAARGHEAIVYTRPAYSLTSQKEHNGVRLVSLPSLNTKHLDAITHTFLATLHAAFSKADIVHFQSIGPALLCWLPKLLRPKMKVVSTLQSRDYEHMKWGGFARLMLRLGERAMCRFSDEVIVISDSMREYVAQEYKREASVIPNGANLYDSVADDNHLSEWNLGKKGYIVAISRLVRHKGLGHLIEAYKNIDTDKKLVIAGAGSFTDDYVAELKKAASGDSRIIFTGSQTGDALAQLYSHASVFVQPSESEGLSLALLEAMARRVPVLVSDIPANRDAVADSGFVFKTGEISDLAAKLSYILSNETEAEEKSIAARNRIEEHYNWDVLVSLIEDVYGRAISTDYSYRPVAAV